MPRSVSFIIDRLNSQGFSAGAVGGAVRDMLLGRAVGDYDITTSARPENIISSFPELRVIETGIKHGTVTLLVEGEPYEVTTYRIDGDYKDNRHPDSVEFTSELSLDLSRRDFTVNAMYYNERDGLVDLFGGTEDLENRLIRAVGEAQRRFSEDGLRILRAIRFASVLGFTVEDGTRAAVHKMAHLLSGISRERIYTELKKLVSGIGAYEVISEYSDVLRVFMPELENIRLPERKAFDSAEWEIRLLSLFALGARNPAPSFCASMEQLKTDKAVRVRGEAALLNYKTDLSKDSDICLLLKAVGEEGARQTVALRRILNIGTDREGERLASLLAKGAPYKTSHLKIGGNDLMALGYSGKDIGNMLELLLKEVILGNVRNEANELLGFIKDKKTP